MATSRDGADRFLNREISWLDFNTRVLTLAQDSLSPLLERAKFLAIFASNLDEFYQVRVAGLKRQIEAGLGARSADGRTAGEQLALIAERVRELGRRHADLFVDDVMPALAKEGVEILRWRDLTAGQAEALTSLFARKIFPVVTPLAVDPAHPFPYVSNLSLNLAVLVRDPSTERILFARVKVPPLLPRFVELAEGDGFVPLEDVIANNLEQLFPGMDIVGHHAFRVTRNAEVEVDSDGAEDLLQALEEELGRRRSSPAVRLEVEEDTPDLVRALLKRELGIGNDDVFALPAPLGLSGLWDLYGIDRPDLKDPPFQSVTHAELVGSEDDVKAGQIHVLYGTGSGVSHEGDQVWQQDVGSVEGAVDYGDSFGSSLATADFDGDGQADVAVGVPAESVNEAPSAGATNVLYGSPVFGIRSAGDQIWSQASTSIEGDEERYDRLGGTPVSSGIYRIGYANGTDVKVSNDHLGHDPLDRIDMFGVPEDEQHTVVAAADGTIRTIVDSNAEPTTNNNYVWIEHPNGEWTKYSHFETGSVSALGHVQGDFVTAGTTLGFEGDVGQASGEHLHWEVAVPSDPTNPHDAAGFIIGENRVPLICRITGNLFIEGVTYSASAC